MVLQQAYHEIITNNIFSSGTFSNGTTPTNYKYDVHIYGATGGNLLIDNNEFTDILAIGDPDSSLNTFITIPATMIRQKIINNKFTRKTSSINSYINAGSNNVHITNNHFDNFTINGTSDILVSNLGSLSIYSNNTNQIIYVAIPLNGFSPNDGDASDYILSTANIQVGALRSYISPFIITTTACEFVYNLNINAALPDNVKILEAKLGIYAINLGATLANDSLNSIEIELNATDIIVSNYATGTNSILDVKNNISTVLETASSTTYNLYTNFTNVTTATQYITVTPTNISNFINTSTICLTGNVLLVAHLSSAGSGVQYELSPLVIKCIW